MLIGLKLFFSSKCYSLIYFIFYICDVSNDPSLHNEKKVITFSQNI